MKIFVKGIEFLGYQGVSKEERTLGHRFVLDLSATLSDGSIRGDGIEETVDYVKLAETAVNLCGMAKDATLEWACDRIGSGLLETYHRLKSVTITLSKLQPAVSLNIESVGVEKTFTRPD